MPLRADRVRQLQQKQGYTNRHIATLIGVNENTVSRWARGTRQPGSLSLNLLAALLDTSTDYLLGTTDEPNPPKRAQVDVTQMEFLLLDAFRRGDMRAITRLIGEDDD